MEDASNDKNADDAGVDRTLGNILLAHPDEWIKEVDWDAFSSRLESHPEEATEMLRNGMYPLHAVVKAYGPGAPLGVVEAVCDAYPGAVTDLDSEGQTALHCAARKASFKEDMDRAMLILRRNPSAASVRDKFGQTPLHKATKAGMVKALVDVYPDALRMRDENGRLPLHGSCYCSSLVKVLVEEGWRHHGGPKGLFGGTSGGGGVFIRDNNGRTPLSYACEKLTHEGVEATILLQAAHSALSGYDRIVLEPTLCCLVGLANRVPVELVTRVLGRAPDDALSRDSLGRTPLHIAAASKWRGRARLVEALVASESGRTMAGMADKPPPGDAAGLDLGRLPLHVAASSARGEGSDEVLKMLIQAEPRALSTTDATTKMLPFMMAAVGNGGSIDAAYLLLREKPDVIGHYVRPGKSSETAVVLKKFLHTHVCPVETRLAAETKRRRKAELAQTAAQLAMVKAEKKATLLEKEAGELRKELEAHRGFERFIKGWKCLRELAMVVFIVYYVNENGNLFKNGVLFG